MMTKPHTSDVLRQQAVREKPPSKVHSSQPGTIEKPSYVPLQLLDLGAEA